MFHEWSLNVIFLSALLGVADTPWWGLWLLVLKNGCRVGILLWKTRSWSKASHCFLSWSPDTLARLAVSFSWEMFWICSHLRPQRSKAWVFSLLHYFLTPSLFSSSQPGQPALYKGCRFSFPQLPAQQETGLVTQNPCPSCARADPILALLRPLTGPDHFPNMTFSLPSLNSPVSYCWPIIIVCYLLLSAL